MTADERPPTQRAVIDGLVSVVIPVFNRAAQLEEAVISVLAQDYRPIEIIIVDDGSTDLSTPAMAMQLATQNPDVVRVVRRDNGGPGLARETGRQLARGEFIQYLDSDDVLLAGKFTAQVAALRAAPDAHVCYGITRYRYADGSYENGAHKETGVEHAEMFPRFLNFRWWSTSTPLFRASICDRAGPWTDLRLEEDWEHDCRVAALGGRLAYVRLPVSETRDHAGGDRLSIGTALDPSRLRMRARAHTLVWGHARRAGLPQTAPREVSLFARELFLLARQCGAAGLVQESADLVALAFEAAEGDDKVRRQLRVYRGVARLAGWPAAGRWSDRIDRVRDRFRRRQAE